MTVYTVEVNSIEVEVDKVMINWVVDNKTLPSWSARMTDSTDAAAKGDEVVIKRDGTAIFVGILEQLDPNMSTSGVYRNIGGRHISVRLWGRWTEKYVDTLGFWQGYYPNKMVEFILNPSRSDLPTEKTRNKRRIGWGIGPVDAEAETVWTKQSVSSEATDWELSNGFAWNRRNANGWRSSVNNQNGQYVELDLGKDYWVVGVRIDNRNLDDNDYENKYPLFLRGYKIETKQQAGLYSTRVERTYNMARNIIESWTPRIIRYIKITGNVTTAFPAEIDEIYVYESDQAISDISEGTLTEHIPLNCTYLTSNIGGGSTVIPVEKGYIFAVYDTVIIRDDSNFEEWGQVMEVDGNNITITTTHDQAPGDSYTGLTFGYLLLNDAYMMNTSTGNQGFDLEYSRRSDAITKMVGKITEDTTSIPWEWWVNDDGTVDMDEQRGSDVSGSIGFSYQTSIVSSNNKQDIRNRLDRVFVVGKKPDKGDQEENAGWSDDEGTVEYETVVIDNSIESPSAAIAKGEILIAESSGKENKISTIVVDGYATNTWGIGDTISMIDSTTGLSGTYRVVGLKRNYNANSGETVTITAESRDPTDAEWLAAALKRIKDEQSKTTYPESVYEQRGYILIFEAERQALENESIVIIDNNASDYNIVQRLDSTSAGHVFGGPNIKLIKGEYRISYTCKVTDNSSSSDLITLGVYSRSKTGGAGYFASQVVKPTDFETSDQYQNIGFTFTLDKDYNDIEFRAASFVASITDWYCDYMALVTNYIVDIPGTPGIVQNVVATPAPLQIQLTWDELDELDFDSYLIYKSTSINPTALYTQTKAEFFADSNVDIGTTYYYRIKGRDWAGNLSTDYSNEVSAQANYISGATDVEPGTLTGDLLTKGIQPYEADIEFSIIEARSSDSNTFDIDVDNLSAGCEITANADTWLDFSVGDEIYIINAEDEGNNTTNWTTQIKTVSSVTSTILTLNSPIVSDDPANPATDNPHDELMIVGVHDAVKWNADIAVNGYTIVFADTTTHVLTDGDSDGLVAGWHYLYFDLSQTPPDDEDVYTTSAFDDTIGDEVGLLCKVQISNFQNNSPIVLPFKSRVENINVDAISAQSIDTRALSGEAIIGKKFYTTGRALTLPTVGIEFDDLGIRGYTGESTMSFELETLTGNVNVYGYDGGFNIYENDGVTKLGELRGNAGTIKIESETNKIIQLISQTGSSITINDAEAGNVVLAGGSTGFVVINSSLIPGTGTPTVGTALAPFTEVRAAHGYFSTGATLTTTVYPSLPAHAATKKYVDDQVSSGIEYLDPVKDKYDPTSGTPGTPSTGDRWISEATANGWTENYIYEWQSSWTNPDGAPSTGDTVFATDTGETWNYNGTTWVLIASAVSHQTLSSLQGGNSPTDTEMYHMTSTAHGYMDIGGTLLTIGAMAGTLNNFIVGSGTNWAMNSPLQSRTALELGTGHSPQFTGLTLTGLSTSRIPFTHPSTSGLLDSDSLFTYAESSHTLTVAKIAGFTLSGNIAGGTGYAITGSTTWEGITVGTLYGGTGFADGYSSGELLIGSIGGSLLRATLTEIASGGLKISSGSGSISLRLDGAEMGTATPTASDQILVDDASIIGDVPDIKKIAFSDIDLYWMDNTTTLFITDGQQSIKYISDEDGDDATPLSQRVYLVGDTYIDVDTNVGVPSQIHFTFDPTALTGFARLDTNNIYTAGYSAFRNIYVYDTYKIFFGDPSGTSHAELYWSGASMFLEFTPTGDIAITATAEGAVTLNHNNLDKLATTATGVYVTGYLNASTGIATNGAVRIQSDGTLINVSSTEFINVSGDIMEGTLTMEWNSTQSQELVFDGGIYDDHKIYSNISSLLFFGGATGTNLMVSMSDAGGVLYGLWSVSSYLTIPETPTADTHAASKGYVDTEVAGATIASIDDIDDVTITTPIANNEVLAWNGSSLWINQTALEAGLATTSDLSDYLPRAGGLMTGDLELDAAISILFRDSGSLTEWELTSNNTYWYLMDDVGTPMITVGDNLVTFSQNANFAQGIDVTGDITVTGFVDGVDLANVVLDTDVISATYGGTNANLSGSTTGAIFRWDGSKFAQLGSAGTGSIIYSSSSNVWDALTTIGASTGDVLTLSLGVPTWQPGAAGSFTSLSDTPGTYTENRMVVATTNTLIWTDFSVGDVILSDGTITMTAHFKPTNGSSYNLGGPTSEEWQHLYLSGSIYFSTTAEESIRSDGTKLIFRVDGTDDLWLDSGALTPDTGKSVTLGTTGNFFGYTYVDRLYIDDTSHYLYESSTDLHIISGSSVLYLGGTVIPVSGTYDLGSVGTPWNEIFASTLSVTAINVDDLIVSDFSTGGKYIEIRTANTNFNGIKFRESATFGWTIEYNSGTNDLNIIGFNASVDNTWTSWDRGAGHITHSANLLAGGANLEIGSIGTPWDKVYADELHGTHYYGDFLFKDLLCPICSKKFEVGDDVILTITGNDKHSDGFEYFRSIPVHHHCKLTSPIKTLKSKLGI